VERESSGKSFQIIGAAWLKARLAISVLTGGLVRKAALMIEAVWQACSH